MTDRRPTVILADDHPMMLEGLRKVLEPSLDVIATAVDGEELLEVATRLQPDLVIADISMPRLDGLEAARRLAKVSPKTWVLILSFHSGAAWVRKAFEAGARGYLTKSAAIDEIEAAVEVVLDGRFYLSPSVTGDLLTSIRAPAEPPESEPAAPPPANDDGLTAREREVVRLVGQGMPNNGIAESLGISVTTVRTHLSSVYDKLGGSNRVELALYAVRSVAGRS